MAYPRWVYIFEDCKGEMGTGAAGKRLGPDAVSAGKKKPETQADTLFPRSERNGRLRSVWREIVCVRPVYDAVSVCSLA